MFRGSVRRALETLKQLLAKRVFFLNLRARGSSEKFFVSLLSSNLRQIQMVIPLQPSM